MHVGPHGLRPPRPHGWRPLRRPRDLEPPLTAVDTCSGDDGDANDDDEVRVCVFVVLLVLFFCAAVFFVFSVFFV